MEATMNANQAQIQELFNQCKAKFDGLDTFLEQLTQGFLTSGIVGGSGARDGSAGTGDGAGGVTEGGADPLQGPSDPWRSFLAAATAARGTPSSSPPAAVAA